MNLSNVNMTPLGMNFSNIGNCFKKENLRPNQAQKEDLEEKAKSQKSKPAKTQDEHNYEVCPDCRIEGIYKGLQTMCCISLTCKRVSYKTTKTITKQKKRDLKKFFKKCCEIRRDLKYAEKNKRGMLRIISCAKHHLLELENVKEVASRLHGEITPNMLADYLNSFPDLRC